MISIVRFSIEFHEKYVGVHFGYGLHSYNRILCNSPISRTVFQCTVAVAAIAVTAAAVVAATAAVVVLFSMSFSVSAYLIRVTNIVSHCKCSLNTPQHIFSLLFDTW